MKKINRATVKEAFLVTQIIRSAFKLMLYPESHIEKLRNSPGRKCWVGSAKVPFAQSHVNNLVLRNTPLVPPLLDKNTHFFYYQRFMTRKFYIADRKNPKRYLLLHVVNNCSINYN